MTSFSDELYLQLAIVLPLAGAIAIRVVKSTPNLREAISLFISASLFTICVALYLGIPTNGQVSVVWLELLPSLTLSFLVEPLGLLFALMSSFLWLVTTIYSIGYMRHHHEKNQTRFYQFFALTMAAVMGIALSANLFTLYIFYELLTLTTYPLVTHAGNSKAKKGGRTYLTVLLFTSVMFFLPAMVCAWLLGSTLDFVQGGMLTQQVSSGITLMILLPLFIIGIGKGAIMPFHRWLPAAMVAPTPVSALLHAVAVVKGGVFAILKVCIYVFGIDLVATLPTSQLLLYLAGFSILVASFIAMRQDNLKKRLAYSTVSQLGYITVGALLANKAGIIGSAMHMAIHGFGKITLFFCAGAVLVVSGRTKISEMTGIGRQMPITMGAFFIASLSVIGLPPTAGLWSKWFLLQATLQAQEWWLLIVLLLSSLLNIFYLLPVALNAFFADTKHAEVSTGQLEAPLPILIAIVTCASACILLFIFPQPLYELATSINLAPDS